MSRFTAGELRVMRLLWKHGESKPSELQERYPEPIKNPALRSYLTILVDKGHVTRRKVSKAYHYKAKTPPGPAFATMLGDLVETFCSGSIEELVMRLVRKEQLSEEDLLELKRLADEPSDESKRRAAPDEPKRGTRRKKP